MSHFLRLPGEVRDVIYECCLVVEGILDPCPPYYEEKNPKNAREKPHTALLRVSQQIGDEAAQVLYRKNVWRISYRKNDPFWPNPVRPRRLSPSQAKMVEYMRHVAVSFDFRDVDHKVLVAISRARFFGTSEPGFLDEQDEEFVHNRRASEVLDIWIWKRRILDLTPSLRSVMLDFSNCFCPSGCCREFDVLKSKHVFQECSSYWPDSDGSLDDIQVFGLGNDMEKAYARNMDWLLTKEERIRRRRLDRIHRENCSSPI